MADWNFLITFAVLLAGIVIGVVLAMVLRKYPATEQNVGQALLLVALALRATFDDAEVAAVAGWIYDNTMVSQYYTRDAWLALVLRVFKMLPQQTATTAAAAAQPAMAASSTVVEGGLMTG